MRPCVCPASHHSFLLVWFALFSTTTKRPSKEIVHRKRLLAFVDCIIVTRMGKKSKRNRSSSKPEGEARPAPRDRVNEEEEEETLENLKFEDPYVDEIIDDDDDDDEEEGEEAMAGEEDVELVQSWHPLMGGSNGQELEMDPSAYKMHHTLTPEWPSLSFDLIRDDLGDARQRFPHSLQAVAGTQADTPENNRLTVIKLSDLSKLPQENDDDELEEAYDNPDDDSSSSSDEDYDLNPILESYNIPHHGGVNRVRCMPQQPDIVATWSDVGNVYLHNIESIRSRFAASEGKGAPSSASTSSSFFTHSGHATEGYALDWSKVKQGNLATGDNDGHIHVWTLRPEGGYEVNPMYTSEGSSVEDIQWSPTEGTVFCAAESGGHVAIYDTRAPQRSMLRHCVHPKTDVNVTNWNGLVTNLMATGADDGTLAVWDLRHFGKSDPVKPLARFTCHKTPITSVEWHPTDESMLAVSDTVGAYIYDLSVEEDAEAQKSSTLVADIPPQLLFCHSGSQEFKELHWHPQISSCIMTTALTGFSVFIPSNL